MMRRQWYAERGEIKRRISRNENLLEIIDSKRDQSSSIERQRAAEWEPLKRLSVRAAVFYLGVKVICITAHKTRMNALWVEKGTSERSDNKRTTMAVDTTHGNSNSNNANSETIYRTPTLAHTEYFCIILFLRSFQWEFLSSIRFFLFFSTLTPLCCVFFSFFLFTSS